jgi:hypothetical protein
MFCGFPLRRRGKRGAVMPLQYPRARRGGLALRVAEVQLFVTTPAPSNRRRLGERDRPSILWLMREVQQ